MNWNVFEIENNAFKPQKLVFLLKVGVETGVFKKKFSWVITKEVISFQRLLKYAFSREKMC